MSISNNASTPPLASASVETAEKAPRADRKPRSREALLWCLASVVVLTLTLVLVQIHDARSIAILGGVLSAEMAGYGLFKAGTVLFGGPKPNAGSSVTLAVFALISNFLMMGLGALLALDSVLAFTRGRQLRSVGRVLLAPVGPNAGWNGLPMEPRVPEHLRVALATHGAKTVAPSTRPSRHSRTSRSTFWRSGPRRTWSRRQTVMRSTKFGTPSFAFRSPNRSMARKRAGPFPGIERRPHAPTPAHPCSCQTRGRFARRRRPARGGFRAHHREAGQTLRGARDRRHSEGARR